MQRSRLLFRIAARLDTALINSDVRVTKDRIHRVANGRFGSLCSCVGLSGKQLILILFSSSVFVFCIIWQGMMSIVSNLDEGMDGNVYEQISRLFVRMINEDAIKLVSSLVERFPNPDEFISALESLDIPENEKGNFFLQLGFILVNLSNFKMVLPVWKRSLEYFIKNKDISRESACYTNLGNAYQNLGDFRKAIDYYNKALETFKKMGDVHGESACYTNLGAAYNNLGNFSKAIEFHEKALEIKKEMGDISGESNCYTNLGNVYHRLEDFSKAIEFHEKALEMDKEIGDTSLFACHTNLGILYEESDDLNRSLDALKKSIEIHESIKGEISLEELRMFFHTQAVSTYGALSFVYLRMGDAIKSINTLERSKTRELADSLFYAEALKENPDFGENIQEKARLKHKVELINTWKSAISEAEKISDDAASIDSIKTEMEHTEREYALVSSRLHRLYDEVAGSRPADYDILSNALDILRKERGWVVLEYMLLPSKSELVIFVINEKGEINPVRSEYDRIKLNSSIKKYAYAVISSSKEKFREDAEGELKEISTDLYNTLFPEAVENAIESVKAEHLIIIPHKELHLVPWEILFNGEDYLGLKYSISKNFSLDLTSIAMNKRMNPNDTDDGFAALLMGNPTLDLDGAETEVYKIEEALNRIDEVKTITLQRDKATKENFIEEIRRPLDIFHFSGHGQFQFPPGFSSLIFNNRNELTANELSGLSFKGSPIVSLSACETGITAPISGDELAGLIRGFIVTGSSSIVSTSWRVYDNSACLLMVEFYKNLLKKNCVGVSLKKARETVFNEHNGEILHWGAYTLYGDPFRSVF